MVEKIKLNSGDHRIGDHRIGGQSSLIPTEDIITSRGTLALLMASKMVRVAAAPSLPMPGCLFHPHATTACAPSNAASSPARSETKSTVLVCKLPSTCAPAGITTGVTDAALVTFSGSCATATTATRSCCSACAITCFPTSPSPPSANTTATFIPADAMLGCAAGKVVVGSSSLPACALGQETAK
eukprot:CAMPEP_0114252096 /NCGR_PEP_ID=MMETSP0058-20121206/15648_1 /TAXON_ID=36894 /ORGANISM="Pyramimonas parkeae, CCMP726" /LENGTH=184 /DNA_ID=CAMNT_0001365995 /DNA_START=680 /DNA_END=1234 /DNA_ORIENTATION=-